MEQEASWRDDQEIAHHALVLVFEDVAVVPEVTDVFGEGDCDLYSLARPHEDRVAYCLVDNSGLD